MRRSAILPLVILGSAAFAVLASRAVNAGANVKTKEITYRHGSVELQGFLAWNDAQKGNRPSVLVVHEWWGHNAHARRQATRLAEAGFVSFALDMYGKGKLAAHPDDAKAFMEEALRDPERLHARFLAALEVLRGQPGVDPAKVAAVGYCFGGSVVLGAARRGVDLAAAVSMHGILATAQPAERGKVKARILVLTGAEDPMIGPDQVEAFKKEMISAEAKFEVVIYPGAKHAFTNPEADKRGIAALAYNGDADRESFAAMTNLFRTVLDK